jgi:hypothetical protein
VILTGGVVISMLNGLDAFAPALSVTVAVKAYVPTAVVGPPSAPPAESDAPGGRLPAVTAHEYGGVPPAAASVREIGPMGVEGSGEAVLTVKAAGLIFRV